MTPEELKHLEHYLLKLTHVGYVERDPQAAELIAVAFATQIDAPYLVVQRCLQLEQDLQEARAKAEALERTPPAVPAHRRGGHGGHGLAGAMA